MFDTIDAQVLHTIITGMVNEKDKVVITRTVTERGVVLNVQVALRDMGIVIGRKGAMAEHIKMIMRAIAKSNGMIVNVVFLEPDGSTRHFEPYSNERSEEESQFNDRGYDNRPSYNSNDSRPGYNNNYDNKPAMQPYVAPSQPMEPMAPAKPTSIVDDLDLDSLIIN